MRPGEAAFFLPASSGQRLCVYAAPDRATRGAVVYLHPFAEEMNKSRRMAALQRRALAAAGYAVLAIDLHGCGDSSGEFEDASWESWIDDALLAAHWLGQRHEAPLWLWGLRAGCLLACAAAERIEPPVSLLFWQPPASGRGLLQQFLRLRLAGGLLRGGAPHARDDGRSEMAAGWPTEVAGYRLAPALARGLESAQLGAPTLPCRALWFEVSMRESAELLPATAAQASAWRATGHRVDTAVVGGPAFWQTQEIEEAPALLGATNEALCLDETPA